MTNKKKILYTFALVVLSGLMMTEPCFAGFDDSLRTLKFQLSNVILPTLATMGLLFAGFSFISGNPNAKQHIIYAVIGCILGFGAQGIVDLISQSVR
jgi:lipopolysaccharide export LptBFGC system permease protein LptF